jgi:hypothetical protein
VGKIWTVERSCATIILDIKIKMNFSPRERPERRWAHSVSYLMGIESAFPWGVGVGGKSASDWRWPLSSPSYSRTEDKGTNCLRLSFTIQCQTVTLMWVANFSLSLHPRNQSRHQSKGENQNETTRVETATFQQVWGGGKNSQNTSEFYNRTAHKC